MESVLTRNGKKKIDQGDISVMKEAMAILQHHDGVSGTSKQHVAEVKIWIKKNFKIFQ